LAQAQLRLAVLDLVAHLGIYIEDYGNEGLVHFNANFGKFWHC
jgi:hypothetical protein